MKSVESQYWTCQSLIASDPGDEVLRRKTARQVRDGTLEFSEWLAGFARCDVGHVDDRERVALLVVGHPALDDDPSIKQAEVAEPTQPLIGRERAAHIPPGIVLPDPNPQSACSTGNQPEYAFYR